MTSSLSRRVNFTRADFGFSDPAENNPFIAVTVSTLPTNGTLLFNGNPVAPDAFILTSDIDAGKLTFQPAFGGVEDGFVAEFDTTVTGTASLLFSTYFGGSGDDYFDDVAAGPSGSLYITGASNSTNYYTTGDSFQPTGGGTYDAVVTRLNAAATNR